MKLILGEINGNRLEDLLHAAPNNVGQVDAAVGYCTHDRLFEWCWDRKIPLRFWGRYDETVPIKVSILETFLGRSSARFECRVVRNYHPKVIWWHGFGAYIGSANLTQKAWFSNIEAGVFLTDEELAASGQGSELEEFLNRINAESSPLTEEIVQEMRNQQRFLNGLHASDNYRNRAARILDSGNVRGFEGLAVVSAKTRQDGRREAFLMEWNSTLEIMRGLARKVSDPANRPSWVSAEAPSGAQADQFLHAHYYQRTFDGAKAAYESLYLKNRGNPDAAVDEAIAWWRALPTAPSGEARMLNDSAPYLRNALSADSLANLTANEFIEVVSRIYATRDFALRVSNDLVGLPSGRNYNREEKIEALARRLFSNSTPGGRPQVVTTLSHVLHGGAEKDLPTRLFTAISDPRWKVDLFGVSAIGESVGWALPDRFPPRNGRSSKALRSLGYDVRVHVG